MKPFACLAFPHTTYLKTPRKQPIFGDELVTSFSVPAPKGKHFQPIRAAMNKKPRTRKPRIKG